MTRPSLSCDEVEELLPLVADGSLDEAGDPTLFLHLADCDRCQHSLATHDLIAVSLPRAARLPTLRIIRPWWQRALPAAAAAMLLIGGGWLVVASRETASPSGQVAPLAGPVPVSAPLPTMAAAVPIAAAVPMAAAVPIAAPVVAATTPKVVAPKPAAHPGSVNVEVEVEVEVVVLPGSTTAHPHYLVRRGEQVLLVTPQTTPAEAPSDARPASYTPSRY